jgi:hypothetical protein
VEQAAIQDVGNEEYAEAQERRDEDDRHSHKHCRDYHQGSEKHPTPSVAGWFRARTRFGRSVGVDQRSSDIVHMRVTR